MANGSTTAKTMQKSKGPGLLSRFGRFIRESYVETTQKSAWPSWKELRQFVIVVIFAILVVAIWIGAIDYVLAFITARL